MSKHYIKIDKNNNIISCFSDAFQKPDQDSRLVNENGDRHFNLNLVVIINSLPQYIYKYDKGKIVLKDFDLDTSLEVKMEILKKYIDELLTCTTWIQDRHTSEERAILENIGSLKTTITNEELKTWLLYWESLRELPKTINLTNVTMEELNPYKSNVVFPVAPSVVTIRKTGEKF